MGMGEAGGPSEGDCLFYIKGNLVMAAQTSLNYSDLMKRTPPFFLPTHCLLSGCLAQGA